MGTNRKKHYMFNWGFGKYKHVIAHCGQSLRDRARGGGGEEGVEREINGVYG